MEEETHTILEAALAEQGVSIADLTPDELSALQASVEKALRRSSMPQPLAAHAASERTGDEDEQEEDEEFDDEDVPEGEESWRLGGAGAVADTDEGGSIEADYYAEMAAEEAAAADAVAAAEASAAYAEGAAAAFHSDARTSWLKGGRTVGSSALLETSLGGDSRHEAFIASPMPVLPARATHASALAPAPKAVPRYAQVVPSRSDAASLASAAETADDSLPAADSDGYVLVLLSSIQANAAAVSDAEAGLRAALRDRCARGMLGGGEAENLHSHCLPAAVEIADIHRPVPLIITHPAEHIWRQR